MTPPEGVSATPRPRGDDAATPALDVAAIEALVHGRHGDPFAVLGRHGDELRCLMPGADGVEAISPSGELLGRLERRHADGFFAGHVRAQGPYALRIHWPGGTQETEDPYSFGPLLGAMDLHLFSEGRHFDIDRVLGAQCMTVDGIHGVRFALWAPNASRVSVVGDFNTWDGRRYPMRKRLESGIWEIFIPRIGPGSLYKYELLDAWGNKLPLKADPLALETEMPPATASRVTHPMPHAWED